MSEDFGSGVSRTLSALARQFSTVVWQSGKPPLDSEFNLMSQISWENLSQMVRSQTPSGFFTDPVRAPEDFRFNEQWVNLFELGDSATSGTFPAVNEQEPVVYANVNGWIIPVTGTKVNAVTNKIALNPPPTADERIDFVFLEVWRSLVAPNPSTLNKPTASTIWKYGNVEYGGTNEPDDLEDPAIGFETTERVQLQYRIRVFGSGAGLGATTDLYTFPDGLDDPNVLGQGAATTPVGGYTFTNMRDALGDASLWRSGDGDAASRTALGTIDGYTYAIPICAVFRRNTAPFTAVVSFGAGNPNENGGAERTPSAASLPDPRDGAVVLTDATLTGILTASATGLVSITGLVGSGLDDPNLFPPATQYIVLGTGVDEEIIGITAVDGPGGTVTISTRGNGYTMAKRHPAGTSIKFYNSRPDGLYSDEIASQDILDLRRSVTLGEWDHQQLLFNALGSLVNNDLRSSFKKAGTGASNAGPVTTEVSYLWANSGGAGVPNHIAQVDGPDSIRTVWSDAAAIQGDITVCIDNNAPLVSNFTSSTWDVNTVSTWTAGAGAFVPTGFLNNTAATGFRNGTSVFLHIGGNSGTEAARGGFWQASKSHVRFVSPQEFWKREGETSQQNPVRLRFLTEKSMVPAVEGETAIQHPGPMYPLEAQNFEKPFIILGGVLNSTLTVTGLPATAGALVANNLYNNPAGTFEINVGFDFDVAGGFYPSGALESLSVTGVTTPVLRGQRTFFDMLTKGGVDRTGASSEVYIVTLGDNLSENNNGAFQVIGAGTVGYTSTSASQATNIVVRPLSQDFVSFDNNAANTINIEFRSQYMNAEDGTGRVAGNAAAVLVLTDIEGVAGGISNPWNQQNVGGTGISQPIASKFILDTTLQWPPSHAAFARIPDEVTRFATRNGGTAYLRNQLSDVDSTFVTNTGNPTDERFYDFSQVQTWNRLPGLGEDAPNAPNYGGNTVGSTEQDRDGELFVDKGSKTIMFRPYVGRNMLLQTQQTGANPSLIGSLNYTVAPLDPKDGRGIFTVNKTLGFPVPPEYMPRFGRQDIPYHTRTGAVDPFMPGINHLFTDQIDDTETVFNVIGGEDNITGGNQVTPILFTTEPLNPYCGTSTLGGPAQPCLIARKFASTKIVSSDLGVGMNGIELPPYYGVARLYGVYEYNDYIAKIAAATALQGAHKVDRITPIDDPPTNLLRTGATKGTLFIRQDGAQDRTGETGDHTYIVPEDGIDISLIPTFTDGNAFNDFNYVVECVVFGFSRNWINGNNVILCREHNGAGTQRLDNADFEITSVKMTLPSAAVSNDELYGAINRTVYQGDPYMTRDGTTIQTADYSNRYGQVANSNAYNLNFTIEQFDATGAMFVKRPNPRSFEVLASADFYTTVGTGKIGGKMYPGTPLDVGFTDTTAGALNRLPSAPTEPEWRVLQRAFTEGQKANTQRAGLVIHLLDAEKVNGVMDTMTVSVTKLDGTVVAFTGHTTTGAGRFTGVSTIDLARDLTDVINDGDKASGTISINNPVTMIAGETISIGGVAFTARAVPATPTEFLLVPASANATANAFATVVTAYFNNPQNSPGVTASAPATNVVTIRAKVGGLAGNLITTTSPSAGVSIPSGFLQFGTASLVANNLRATWAYDRVCIQAIPEGAQGKLIKVSLSRVASGWVPLTGTPIPVTECAQIEDKKGNLLYPVTSNISAVTSAFLVGAEDVPTNAGDGDSPINMVGLTERLPLGILVSDSDFLFEDPLADSGSFMKVSPGDLRPVFSENLPLTTGGDEFTRFLGSPGELLSMSDGSILAYVPTNPGALPVPLGPGAESFRLYRGGGSSFLLSGTHPGGPLSWLVDSFAPAFKPVLKGAVLACKALLVRNFTETAFAPANTRSTGDEIQMVVLTQAIYGDGDTVNQGVPLKGEVSPTGYGEGFAAVDRYRLPARPMSKGRSRTTPNPSIDPAPIFKPNS